MDSSPVDPDSEAPALTRDLVESLERPAWTVRGEMTYHFDGINWWVDDGSGEHSIVWIMTPISGWHHRKGCNCSFCDAPEAL